jgi:hypothetical protein
MMKNIKDFEDYLVDESGNIFSSKYGKLKPIKQQYHIKGYKVVTLVQGDLKKTLKVHRLVALAFIGNPLNKKQVNHINGNKEDNNILNLEWATQSENQLHAHRTGLMDNKINLVKLKSSKQVYDPITNKYFVSLKDACEQNNIKYKTEFARIKYYNTGRFIFS